jgi:hypothetical protein
VREDRVIVRGILERHEDARVDFSHQTPRKSLRSSHPLSPAIPNATM